LNGKNTIKKYRIMEKRKIDFDVNLISKISFRPSYHNDTYKWRNETITRKYKKFLWFKWESGLEIKPEGFYEERSSCYYGDNFWQFISEDYLIQCGYLIKDVGIIGGISESKEVWRKPHVEVSLGPKSGIGKIFDTDEEAITWIEHLKMISGKTFETVELK
jgi:hypothetical protein